MATESSWQLAYPCPHCQIMLEPPEDLWQGWVRCPRCGQPGLPPKGLQHALVSKHTIGSVDRAASGTEGRSPVAIASAPVIAPGAGSRPEEPSWTPRPAGDGLRSRSSSSAWLLIAGTGLVVSAFLLLVAWLDRSLYSSVVFGSLTAIFLVALLSLPRKQKGPRDEAFLPAQKPSWK
ncbi:MAG: hypothetical protein ACLP7Q_16045 [Isosphaeraceae bacterium]